MMAIFSRNKFKIVFIIRLSSIQLLKLFANYWKTFQHFFSLFSFIEMVVNFFFQLHILSIIWIRGKKFIIIHKNAVLISNFINIFVWLVFRGANQLYFFIHVSLLKNRNFKFIWTFPFLWQSKLRVQRAQMGWNEKKKIRNKREKLKNRVPNQFNFWNISNLMQLALNS